MKKKRCAERADGISLIGCVASLFVTTLKAKGTDARRCIVTVAKDGRARNDRIRKENQQDQGNH